MSETQETARPHRSTAPLGFAAGLIVVLIASGTFLYLSGWRPSSFGQLAHSGNPLAAQAERGRQLYNANCLSCHGGPEIEPEVPGHIEYPPRHNAAGHTWQHADCELKLIVREGGDEMTARMREMSAPPNAPQMQPYKDRLSADEIDAILAYIKSMWTLEERQIQAQISLGGCAS